MKINFLSLLVALLISVTVSLGQSKTATRMMASSGQVVHVSAYPVKAAKRAQYERFVHTIFWPGARKLSAADQNVFRQTRVMHPAGPNPNGTYTYAFIMDPYIKGGDYDIESLTKKMYGAQKGAEYYKLFLDAIVGEGTDYQFTQSKD